MKCPKMKCRIACLLLLLAGGGAFARERGAYEAIRIAMPEGADALTERAAAVFMRVAEEHAGRRLSGRLSGGAVLTLELDPVDSSLPAEGYRIARCGADSIRICASDGRGVLYGLGHLLHTARFDGRCFVPDGREETSAPDKPVRGIYLATHFRNFYHAAPVEEVVRYIEELALWGYNHLQVWFDMHHYAGCYDPEACEMRRRLAAFLTAGKAVGMKTGLTMLANEGYASTPEHLRARKVEFTDFYGVEICPSVRGGTELILRQVGESLDAFAALGVRIDHVQLWPYDQGGCTCEACSPWGGNGFLKIGRRIAGEIRRKLPDATVTLSTWLFDFQGEDKGEWRALAEEFAAGTPWADCIMADSHTTFPRYLSEHPVPGGLPLLNFPEISMWGNFPWGGYGANPQPGRFQRLWSDAADRVAGGYPYSEGIYEDANKVMYSQFYWDRNRPARETLRRYVAFEFSAAHADRIVEAIEILEKNYGLSASRWGRGLDDRIRIKVPDSGAAEALRILRTVDRPVVSGARGAGGCCCCAPIWIANCEGPAGRSIAASTAPSARSRRSSISKMPISTSVRRSTSAGRIPSKPSIDSSDHEKVSFDFMFVRARAVCRMRERPGTPQCGRVLCGPSDRNGHRHRRQTPGRSGRIGRRADRPHRQEGALCTRFGQRAGLRLRFDPIGVHGGCGQLRHSAVLRPDDASARSGRTARFRADSRG